MHRLYPALLIIILIVCGACLVKGCSTPQPKRYTIARDNTWYPMHLMGKEKNLQGFCDDLIYAIAAKEGLKVTIINESSNNLMLGLDNGTYDLAVSFLFPNPSLKEYYDFSDPFYYLGPVLVLPEDSKITSLEQMQNKVIGIKNESSTVFDVVNYPSIIIVPYESMVFALESLGNGHIDGVIMPLIPAFIYTTSFYKGKLKIGTPPLTQEGLRIVATVESDGDKFIKIFNKGLQEAKETGIYDALLLKWDLFNPETLKTSSRAAATAAPS